MAVMRNFQEEEAALERSHYNLFLLAASGKKFNAETVSKLNIGLLCDEMILKLHPLEAPGSDSDDNEHWTRVPYLKLSILLVGLVKILEMKVDFLFKDVNLAHDRLLQIFEHEGIIIKAQPLKMTSSMRLDEVDETYFTLESDHIIDERHHGKKNTLLEEDDARDRQYDRLLDRFSTDGDVLPGFDLVDFGMPDYDDEGPHPSEPTTRIPSPPLHAEAARRNENAAPPPPEEPYRRMRNSGRNKTHIWDSVCVISTAEMESIVNEAPDELFRERQKITEANPIMDKQSTLESLLTGRLANYGDELHMLMADLSDGEDQYHNNPPPDPSIISSGDIAELGAEDNGQFHDTTGHVSSLHMEPDPSRRPPENTAQPNDNPEENGEAYDDDTTEKPDEGKKNTQFEEDDARDRQYDRLLDRFSTDGDVLPEFDLVDFDMADYDDEGPHPSEPTTRIPSPPLHAEAARRNENAAPPPPEEPYRRMRNSGRNKTHIWDSVCVISTAEMESIVNEAPDELFRERQKITEANPIMDKQSTLESLLTGRLANYGDELHMLMADLSDGEDQYHNNPPPDPSIISSGDIAELGAEDNGQFHDTTGPVSSLHLDTGQPNDNPEENGEAYDDDTTEKPDEGIVISLHELTLNQRKNFAARAFYNALVFKGDGLINMEQKEPYGDIVITCNAEGKRQSDMIEKLTTRICTPNVEEDKTNASTTSG